MTHYPALVPSEQGRISKRSSGSGVYSRKSVGGPWFCIFLVSTGFLHQQTMAVTEVECLMHEDCKPGQFCAYVPNIDSYEGEHLQGLLSMRVPLLFLALQVLVATANRASSAHMCPILIRTKASTCKACSQCVCHFSSTTNRCPQERFFLTQKPQSFMLMLKNKFNPFLQNSNYCEPWLMDCTDYLT